MLQEQFTAPESDLRRYEALLEMADLLVHHGSLTELFEELGGRLREVTSFDYANFSLHDPSGNMMRLHIWAGAEMQIAPLEIAVADAPSGWVWEKQQVLIIPDLNAERRYPTLLGLFREKGIRSYCAVPLTSSQKRLGALGFASLSPNAYDENDVRLLRRVAALCALAIENSLNRQALEEDRERWQALVEVSQTLTSKLDMDALLATISSSVGRVVPHDFSGIGVYDEEARGLRTFLLGAPAGQLILRQGEIVPLDKSICGKAFCSRQAESLTVEDVRKSRFAECFAKAGIRFLLNLPLLTPKRVVGVLNVGTTAAQGFSDRDQALLKQVAAQLAIALDNAAVYSEIGKLKDRLAEEKLYLQEEIRTELNFAEIIGESAALKRVLSQIKTVAPTDSTVLILGETGTGKELVARAIHRLSSRHEATFIKVNCAAIPTGLLESELFGHEKGAFTGAISQKLGRIELADNGTLFLDEVGEIPLDLQPKLLRVLQDQEFERLGSAKTLRVNVRLIAATNRDLHKSVADRQYRSDLFYRLNVFPIVAPPLRERTKDIPLLVHYFVDKFARRLGKSIQTIPADTMNILAQWKWLGNVRELENFIERSVILSEGSVLRVPLAELTLSANDSEGGTLRGVEREHILRVLRECSGAISGKGGAAERLGMKRTTLQSRMAKLGIERADFQI